MRSTVLQFLLCCCTLALSSCSSQFADEPREAALRFSMKLDPQVYSRSQYKKPPQFAVWIESPDASLVRTVWVTQKTGKGSWGGKTTRPVSLPYWVGRWNVETGSRGDPTPENPVIDAVTGATPKEQLRASIEVRANSELVYFVEVNVSGDYNEAFDKDSKNFGRIFVRFKH